MSYCYVFKRWDYHNAPCHDSWQATQGGAPGTGGHAAASVADVGGGYYLDDDFFPFIGLLIGKMFIYVFGYPAQFGLGWLFFSLVTVSLGFMIKRK